MVFLNTEFKTDEGAVNLLLIDDSVNNYQRLISATTSDTEVVLLNSMEDGVQQVSQAIARYDRVSSLHFLSHGKAGAIDLGGSELSFDNIDIYTRELTKWQSKLTEQADIILYGCNVASNEDGQYLIDSLSAITGADVAASVDLTGNQSLGGNWNWEYVTGNIESALPFERDSLAVYDGIFNMQGMPMSSHHSLHDLTPHSQATHIAIDNGGWFDPNTWKNGSIPNSGAHVLIPQGLRVYYGRESEARLDTLRVDGTLKFAHQRNTKMLVDTFVVSPQGKLLIGTALKPIQNTKTAQIIFTSDSAIDTEWDSQQISRGLISHGEVQINGADKLDFTALRGDALAGDNQLVLKLPSGMDRPQGWRIGDRLVLGGTDYNRRGNDEDNSRFQDEVLIITAIDGNRISFVNEDITTEDNTVLRFDHKRPENYQNELKLYVANTTRNVSFSTENGATAPTKQRGHVMFMHNPQVRVNNAGFYDLGRTDKNRLIDDPVQNVDGTVGRGNNPRGRYALHFHRTGADDLNGMAAIASGNAVVGSPGWGIAHHDSNAIVENNVIFDVVGAGIAAEAGNEIGSWRNNITIKTTGDEHPDSVRQLSLNRNSQRTERFDFGFDGEGYWVQGAGQVAMIDNIAISAAGAGIMHYGGGDGGLDSRDAQTIAVANLPKKYRAIARGTKDETVVDVSAVPLRRLSGFKSYNSNRGISFWAAIKNLDGMGVIEGTQLDSQVAHQYYSEVDNFKVWNTRKAGIHFHYSSQVELTNGLIVSDNDDYKSSGILGNASAVRHNFDNIRIDGFEVGMNVPLDGGVDFVGSQLKNSTFTRNKRNFDSKTEIGSTDRTGFSGYFQIVDTTFDSAIANSRPTPKFSVAKVGGLAVKLDASESFDRDSSYSSLDGKGIVSYGWDFNRDGTIDKFGRQVNHNFDKPGSYTVALKVWDEQGTTSTLKKNIQVESRRYQNLIENADFENGSNFIRREALFGSSGADLGWIASNNWSNRSVSGNTTAQIATGNSNRGIGQVILDNRVRRGKQTLSLDIKNIEGNKFTNQVSISVWGINGEFINPYWSTKGPQQLGAIPLKKDKLLQQTIGGNTFDWTTFNWDLSFNDGYEYIVFQINPVGGLNPTKGDFFAIDNIKIN